jgi:hypothetical protein
VNAIEIIDLIIEILSVEILHKIYCNENYFQELNAGTTVFDRRDTIDEVLIGNISHESVLPVGNTYDLKRDTYGYNDNIDTLLIVGIGDQNLTG